MKFNKKDFFNFMKKEQKYKEATEKDEGKLCIFSNDGLFLKGRSVIAVLRYAYIFGNYETEEGEQFDYCRVLTPTEVEKYTGYKVEERRK